MQPTQKLLSHHSPHYGASTGWRAGQSVTAARGTVGHPARQGERCPKEGVRADTFRTYRYCVDRSPRRISRKGICRDLIGDMLDSYPYYNLVYPCRAGPWEQPFAELSSFLVQQRTMQSNKLPLAPQYNTQSKLNGQCKGWNDANNRAY